MTRTDDIEYRTLIRAKDGIWTAYPHATEDDAVADAQWQRRNHPGHEVKVQRLVPDTIYQWGADEIHPRAIA